MAFFEEHQLRTRNLVSRVGCVIDQGKDVVGALGDKCWRCYLGEGQWSEFDLVQLIVPLAGFSSCPWCEGGGENNNVVKSDRIRCDPVHCLSFLVLVQTG
jgi:hypothetical protein